MKIKDLLKKEYDLVEYRIRLNADEAQKAGKTSVFAGIFRIKGGKLISLDGDTYDLEQTILEQEEWSCKRHPRALTILVK